MYNLLKPKSNNILAEAAQSLIVKFAFARFIKDTNDVQRLHEWVMCRDFLGDVLWAKHTKKPTSIYAFDVSPDIVKIDPHKTVLVIQFPNEQTVGAFRANYEHIVWAVEDENKLKRTVIHHTTNPLEYVIVADKFWQQSIWLISLYSFLLKASCFPYKNVVQWRTEVIERGVVESNYMAKVNNYWEALIGRLHDIMNVKNVSGISDKDFYISKVHNNCGFVSVIGNHKFMQKHNLFSKRVAELLWQTA